MALTPVQRAVLADEVRKAYDEYQQSKRAVETKIRAEIEARIAAEQGSILMELSKTLHEYHRKGLSKKALRVATRKYGNADEFAKMWDVYQPEDSFTLAAGRSANPDYEFKDGVLYWYKWSDGTTMESPFIFTDYNTETGEVYRPDILDAPARDYGVKELSKHVSEAVTKEYAIGRIESRTTFYEQYQAGAISLAEYEEKMHHGENVNADWKDYN